MIKETKRRRLDKEKVKELYIKGWTPKEIAKHIDSNEDTVKKCILRNFQEYKEEHLFNKQCNKEIKKAVRDKYNSYMSDRSVILMNRQSYKYDNKLNLIFNEERGTIPDGMPKKIRAI